MAPRPGGIQGARPTLRVSRAALALCAFAPSMALLGGGTGHLGSSRSVGSNGAVERLRALQTQEARGSEMSADDLVQQNIRQQTGQVASLSPARVTDDGRGLIDGAPRLSSAERVRAVVSPDGGVTLQQGARVTGVSYHIGLAGKRAATIGSRVKDGELDLETSTIGVHRRLYATQDGVEDLVEIPSAERGVSVDVSLPTGWRLRAAHEVAGLVEVRDGRDVSMLRLRAPWAWTQDGSRVQVTPRVSGHRVSLDLPEGTQCPCWVDPSWTSAGLMLEPRVAPVVAKLADGKVIVAGGTNEERPDEAQRLVERLDPISLTYSIAGQLALARGSLVRGGLLSTGELFVTGGGHRNATDNIDVVNPPEVYDPSTRLSRLIELDSHLGFEATVVIGNAGDAYVIGRTPMFKNQSRKGSVLRYDPVARAFSSNIELQEFHSMPTAVVLADGQLLIASRNYQDALKAMLVNPATAAITPVSVEEGGDRLTITTRGKIVLTGMDLGKTQVFSPQSLSFEPGPNLVNSRLYHSTVPLPDGRILLVGGYDKISPLESTEILDLERGSSTSVGPLVQARYFPSTALLNDGRVIVIGGNSQSGLLELLASSEIFSVDTADLFAQDAMLAPRTNASFVPISSGEMLTIGGRLGADLTGDIERYDPVTRTSRSLGKLIEPRRYADAIALPGGDVLVSGGFGSSNLALTSIERFNPTTGVSRRTGDLAFARRRHKMTLLSSGNVLVTGGTEASATGDPASSYAEIYDPQSDATSPIGPMQLSRRDHCALEMTPGKVFVAGGAGDDGTPTNTSEWYDEGAGIFTAGPTMSVSRSEFACHRLDDGRILLAGGLDGVDVTKKVDLITTAGQLAPSAFDSNPFFAALSTPLADGRIALFGGCGKPTSAAPNVYTQNFGAQLFSPTNKVFFPWGNAMDFGRAAGAALEVSPGLVALVGGTRLRYDNTEASSLGLAEITLHDVTSNTRSPALSTLAQIHQSIRLPDGDVLVVGYSTDDFAVKDNLYQRIAWKDGSITSWPASKPRRFPALTLLDDGRVLISGGFDGKYGPGLDSCEIFDPTNNSVSPTFSLLQGRGGHTAVLDDQGDVLVLGGAQLGESSGSPPTQTIERCSVVSGACVTLGPSLSNTRPAAAWLPGGQLAVASPGVTAITLLDATTLEPTGSLNDIPMATVPFLVPTSTGGLVVLGPSGATLVDVARGTIVEKLELGGAGGALTWTPDGLLASTGKRSFQVFDASMRLQFSHPTTPALSSVTSVIGADTLLTTGVIETPLAYPNWEDSRLWLQASRVSPSAIRPRVTGVPARLTPGVSVTIQGERFTRPAGVGAEALDTMRNRVPSVVWFPTRGVGPIYGEVESFDDSTIHWKPPTTYLHGTGWVHVIVDSVVGEGKFAYLEPAVGGSACVDAGACASGFCVDGVCCDRACKGSCEACAKSIHGGDNADGVCTPVVEGLDPRDGCDEEEPTTCGRTGVCDGKGECQRQPDGVICVQNGVCSQGVCLASPGPCTSNADCAEGQLCRPDGTCGVFRDPGDATALGCSFGPPPTSASSNSSNPSHRSHRSDGPASSWILLLAISSLVARRSSERPS